MKAAFYKGATTLFDKAACMWDKGPYSHMEIVLDDGTCMSSSFRDGGVRTKNITFNAGKWDFIVLPPEFSESYVKDYFAKYKNAKYDLLGTFGFVIGPFQCEDKQFCSEFCMGALGYDEAWRYTPNTAFSVLYRALIGANRANSFHAESGNITYHLGLFGGPYA